ncbi:hypothetical protein PRIPAC_94454 [Pristionchus pacificus]|uniref:Uncharacterized protein n=1 Tax=Pristionchus pacificus TaxID=54126 RepID=A0A2A6BPZ1_PRIPA|nr:hypothetical protein PRIPAC_94454 [Pristionchus pacificus]|eukprot:PDM67843.1 hypothetical protein PRIPAC_45887 [Pristionchus pacificus]
MPRGVAAPPNPNVLVFTKLDDVPKGFQHSVITEDGAIWFIKITRPFTVQAKWNGQMLEVDLSSYQDAINFMFLGNFGKEIFFSILRDQQTEKFYKIKIVEDEINMELIRENSHKSSLTCFNGYYAINHDRKELEIYRIDQDMTKGDGIRINVDGVPIFTGSDAFHRGKIIVCLNGGKEPKASRKKPNVIMCRSQDFFQPDIVAKDDIDFVFISCFESNHIKILNPKALSFDEIPFKRPPGCKSSSFDRFAEIRDGRMTVMMADGKKNQHLWTTKLPDKYWKKESERGESSITRSSSTEIDEVPMKKKKVSCKEVQMRE